MAGAAFEGALKIAALIDLARRPASQIRGSKRRWASAIAVINSLGAVPILYFVLGRRAAEIELNRTRSFGPLRLHLFHQHQRARRLGRIGQ